MKEVEFRKPWDVFEIYLNQAVEYFESFEDMNYEECTLRDQLQSILNHIHEIQYFRKGK